MPRVPDPQRHVGRRDQYVLPGRAPRPAVRRRGGPGRPVTFVQGSADTPTWERAHGSAVPTALTLDHVMASAALPIVFPAVRIGAEYYGDGSIRQTAPLGPALRRGATPARAARFGGCCRLRNTPRRCARLEIRSAGPPTPSRDRA